MTKHQVPVAIVNGRTLWDKVNDHIKALVSMLVPSRLLHEHPIIYYDGKLGVSDGRNKNYHSDSFSSTDLGENTIGALGELLYRAEIRFRNRPKIRNPGGQFLRKNIWSQNRVVSIFSATAWAGLERFANSNFRFLIHFGL